jgi:ABC-type lipoprotein export system ATPase subunit
VHKDFLITLYKSKSSHKRFTFRKGHCPAVNINQTITPQTKVVQYIEVHLDCKVNWKEHNDTKRKHIDLKTKEIKWLKEKKSQLSIQNKLLFYKAVIKPICS